MAIWISLLMVSAYIELKIQQRVKCIVFRMYAHHKKIWISYNIHVHTGMHLLVFSSFGRSASVADLWLGHRTLTSEHCSLSLGRKLQPVKASIGIAVRLS